MAAAAEPLLQKVPSIVPGYALVSAVRRARGVYLWYSTVQYCKFLRRYGWVCGCRDRATTPPAGGRAHLRRLCMRAARRRDHAALIRLLRLYSR